MKKDLNINFINIDKDSKCKIIDLIEIDISKAEISFVQKERSKNQLIPIIESESKLDKDKKKIKKLLRQKSGGGGFPPPPPPPPPPEIGSDDPANETEPDATAWVLMDGPFYNTPGNPDSGFVGAQSWRKMEPSAPVNGRAAYVYGDEGVNWTGTQWQYTNTTSGVIASSSSDVAFPWLATWTNGYSGAKITSTYNKTTNYPAVP